MKRGLIILIIAVTLGVGMFFGSQQMLKPCDCVNMKQMPVENGSLLPGCGFRCISRSLNLKRFRRCTWPTSPSALNCANACSILTSR